MFFFFFFFSSGLLFLIRSQHQKRKKEKANGFKVRAINGRVPLKCAGGSSAAYRKTAVVFPYTFLIFFCHSLNDTLQFFSRYPRPTKKKKTGGFETTGRCPTKIRDPDRCPPASDRTDECTTDQQCNGESKCCSDGCRRVCVMPLLTCEF